MPSGVFTALVRFFGRLFWRPLRPEHAKEGLEALRLAEGVFHASKGMGGMYSHPWYVNRIQIDSQRLFEDLENLGNRARNRKLKKELNGIIENLKLLWVNAVQGPLIVVDDYVPFNPAQQEIDNKRAERQQVAYDNGLPLISKARKRVTKLESRMDLA
jgi:hypothetical protein